MELKSALLFKDIMCSDVALACWHNEGMQQLAGTLNNRSILSSLFLSRLNLHLEKKNDKVTIRIIGTFLVWGKANF